MPKKLQIEDILKAYVDIAAVKKGGYAAVTFEDIAAKVGRTHTSIMGRMGGKKNKHIILAEYLSSLYQCNGLTEAGERVYQQLNFCNEEL